MPQAAAEQGFLKLSIAVTVAVASAGVVFGLLSGSMSIVFDGVFSAIDAAMSGLALFVSRLVSRVADNRRFTFRDSVKHPDLFSHAISVCYDRRFSFIFW